MSGVIVLYYI
jgi:nucleolar complex protein 2